MSKYVFKPYNALFPQLFLLEKERISSLLTGDLRIEHVGSTAVPGLDGKGIIDIAISAPEQQKEAVKFQLQELGYEFRPQYSSSERLYFVAMRPDPEEGTRRYHVHVMRKESSEWRHFIAFRDALRADPRAREEYAALKQQAAAEAQGVGDVYRAGKKSIFAKIIPKMN